MEYRLVNINMKIVIFLTFYLHVFSAGQSEFPCTFPCSFRNKTFDLYQDLINAESPFTTWTFNADGSAATVFGDSVNCFQVSEQFLIIRVENSSIFLCFPIFYTAGQSNFTFVLRGNLNAKEFENVSSALNQSQLCEVCGVNNANTVTVVAIEQPSSYPDSVTPAVCQVPSFCPSNIMTSCPEEGSIPTECSGVTTNSPTTVTTDTPTTTTSEIPTTIGTKKPCARRRHKHTNGH
ncbi:uncharacterized protein LOC134726098 [Mytilus trossulus]|uniref:uncharacterized protein LOC134726098 n=1 Tax=Mytilus trossulus TaxID=6551 RepID=UPI003003B5A7